MKETIVLGNRKHPVSPLQFGLFLEDINWGCDGGLNANMVNNHSFEGVYYEKGYTERNTDRKEFIPSHYDGLRFWHISGGKAETRQEGERHYAHLEGPMTIANRGYDGGRQHIGQCGMDFVSGQDYVFSCWLRGEGKITVCGSREDGSPVTTEAAFEASRQWTEVTAQVTCSGDCYGQLVIQIEGTVELDCVVFRKADVWGKDDPKWTGGHFRRDMVEAMAALKPKFLRFPGGCITEGMAPGNEYNWKYTVGPLIDRKGIPNLWALRTRDKSYFQSNQIGFYEYFCLCEDLGMEPLPVVWAGHSCQFRSLEKLLPEMPGFREKVIDSALDLIEFANGDPEKNPWAKLRADMGHPAPFGLKLISIGNENWGEDYFRVFGIVKAEIDARYPGMTCVFSTGAFMLDQSRHDTWAEAKAKHPDAILDEHYYQDKSWLYDHTRVYDDYERCGPKVFLGEYAAFNMGKPYSTNTFASALSEAAYLTGVERNCDIVTMTSYAPLFCMAGGQQWNHDLIFFNHHNVMKTVNYFVQQMYSCNVGTHSLELAYPQNPGLYTSATEDDAHVYLKVVNAGRKSAEIAVQQPGAEFKAARATILHSTKGDAKNKLSYFGAPEYNVVPETQTVDVAGDTASLTLQPRSFAVLVIEKK